MRAIQLVLILLPFTIAPATAQTQARDEGFRQEWLLCQSGDVDRCIRLLRRPLDGETRVLIEADLEQARERVSVQVRTLLHLCKSRGNVSACDRALRYSLPPTDRSEILEIRKSVVHRASQRAGR